MDTATIIIAAILIGLSIIPFTLMARGRRKEEREQLQALSNLANKYNCQISQHEICGNFGIGIDDSKNSLFYYEKTKDAIIEEFIDLTTVLKCDVYKTTRTIAAVNDTLIDRLELCFSPILKNKPDVMLEFFNIDSRSHLNGELQIAEKWSKLINQRLQSVN